MRRVHLFARDPVSGTYLGFKELAMGFQDYGTNVQYFTNYTQIAEAVAKDPNGIGYACLLVTPYAGGPARFPSMRVAPSANNVNGKKYLYFRQLYFYTDAGKKSWLRPKTSLILSCLRAGRRCLRTWAIGKQAIV